MKYNQKFVLLTVFTLLAFSFGQQTATKKQDVCQANQCSNLVSSQVFKYIEEIKSIESDCIQNCNGLKCILECSSNKIYNPDLLRFKKCFENECLASTLVNSLQSLKNILSASVRGDCTASLRNQCTPWINIYYCPRSCLINWVPTECTPCAYDYC